MPNALAGKRILIVEDEYFITTDPKRALVQANDASALPEAYPRAPRAAKPFSAEAVIAIVAALCSERGAA